MATNIFGTSPFYNVANSIYGAVNSLFNQPQQSNPVSNQTTTSGWAGGVPDYTSGIKDVNALYKTGQITPKAATSYNAPAPSGGGGGGVPAAPSQDDILRNQISSGWDSYINSLNSQMGGLNDQRGAQEQIVNSQYDQGVNTLGNQLSQGQTQLGTQRTLAEQNQGKTLRDLSENIRNSFMAGNIYLGSRGAGDSSAANQYAYALTKMGSQQRGDIAQNTANIMNDIGQRETALQNTYNTEIKNLELQKNSAINQIASWFADAQRQIQSMVGQAGLGKSQDLANLSQQVLNQAVSALSNVNSQAVQLKSTIDSNLQQQISSLGQAGNQMASASTTNYTMPKSYNVAGTPTVDFGGNYRAPAGYGGQTTDERRPQQNFTPNWDIG